jgi:hypothetical protein
MRRPSIFKKTDVTRAIKAVIAAGLDVERAQIDKNGTITVIPAKTADAVNKSDPRNEWD